MLTIGGAAGAASFTHVHNVAAAHGQPGWLAWADAFVLELMSIASGLELRRRKRVGIPTRFPAVVLGCAVTLSLAAQVVEAEPSAIGWIAAAVPALGFLVMVKIALGHTAARPAGHPHRMVAPPGWSDVASGTTATKPGRSATGRPSGVGSRRPIPAGPCAATPRTVRRTCTSRAGRARPANCGADSPYAAGGRRATSHPGSAGAPSACRRAHRLPNSKVSALLRTLKAEHEQPSRRPGPAGIAAEHPDQPAPVPSRVIDRSATDHHDDAAVQAPDSPRTAPTDSTNDAGDALSPQHWP